MSFYFWLSKYSFIRFCLRSSFCCFTSSCLSSSSSLMNSIFIFSSRYYEIFSIMRRRFSAFYLFSSFDLFVSLPAVKDVPLMIELPLMLLPDVSMLSYYPLAFLKRPRLGYSKPQIDFIILLETSPLLCF